MNRKIIKIKDFRSDRGWTQEHLAEISGLSTRTIQRIEKGLQVDAGTALAISIALGVPLEILWASQNFVEPNAEDLSILDTLRKEIMRHDYRSIILARYSTGPTLIDAIRETDALKISDGQPNKFEMVKLVASFVQDLHELVDVKNTMNSATRISTTSELTKKIQLLEHSGISVFAGSRTDLLKPPSKEIHVLLNAPPKEAIRKREAVVVLAKHDSSNIQKFNSGFEVLVTSIPK